MLRNLEGGNLIKIQIQQNGIWIGPFIVEHCCKKQQSKMKENILFLSHKVYMCFRTDAIDCITLNKQRPK